MRKKMLPARSPFRLSLSLIIIFAAGLFLAWPVLSQVESPLLTQEALESPALDVNPFLNLLALALIIERLLEIGVTFFPGLEGKKIEFENKPDQLAKLRLAILQTTMLVGMAMGVLACIIWKFGIIDEIFPGRISNLNIFNQVITGIIAGAGADPVHQLVLILVSVRQRLGITALTRR
jgi:hypothetical protein